MDLGACADALDGAGRSVSVLFSWSGKEGVSTGPSLRARQRYSTFLQAASISFGQMAAEGAAAEGATHILGRELKGPPECHEVKPQAPY
jgi:hypothetical protein